MTAAYEAGQDAGVRCPNCGAFCTRPHHTPTRNILTLLGGVIGSALTVHRLVGKTHPLFASTLIAGAAIGAICGATLGLELGLSIDQILRRHNCLACGEEF